MTLRNGPQRGLQRRLAAAHHGQLRALRQQRRQRVDQQVDALLLGEPTDDAKQRRDALHRQTQLQLQGTPAGALAFDLIGAEGCGDGRIGGRVPDRAVDPVEDAVQHARPRPQQAVKAAALLGREDLAGVGGAHGGDRIGKRQPALDERKLAVKLQRPRVEQRRRQAEFGQRAGIEQALVGEVVDREDPAHRRLVPGRGERQIDRRQAGMPVVTVQDLRSPVGIGAHRQARRRPAEPAKAQMAVGVRVAAGVGVRIGVGAAAKPARHVDHIGRQVAHRRQAPDAQHAALAPRRLQFRHRLGVGQAGQD